MLPSVAASASTLCGNPVSMCLPPLPRQSLPGTYFVSRAECGGRCRRGAGRCVSCRAGLARILDALAVALRVTAVVREELGQLLQGQRAMLPERVTLRQVVARHDLRHAV